MLKNTGKLLQNSSAISKNKLPEEQMIAPVVLQGLEFFLLKLH